MARLDEVNFDEFDFDSPDDPVIKAKVNRKMKRRPVISFELMSEDAFEALFGRIVLGMKDNPDFVEPWFPPGQGPTMAGLEQLKDDYSGAKAASKGGDKAEIAARKAFRATSHIDLKKLARYVELKADGDVEMMERSGFDLSKVPAPRSTLPLDAPQDLRLKHGELPGTLLARCKAVKGATGYETQVCIGDTGVEANWKPAAFTSGCRRIVLSGLTAGTIYHVRVRAINKNGPGAWSDAATLMAM